MLKLIFNLAIISGIFKKSEEKLDILPPPPPFPEIIVGEKGAKDAEDARIGEERQRQEGEIEEGGLRKKERGAQEKRKLFEKRRKEKLKVKGGGRKKKAHNLPHKAGLIKAEKEKKEIGGKKKKQEKGRRKQKGLKVKRSKGKNKKRLEKRKQIKISEQKKKAREMRKIEEKQKITHGKKERRKFDGEKEVQEQTGISDIDTFKELPSIAPEEMSFYKDKPKNKTFFEKIFGKKKGDTEFGGELKGIEDGATEEIQEFKFPENLPKTEIERPKELSDADAEIQKAIDSMADIKVPSIVKDLFKKKRLFEGKIETPEVMPRTYDKVDNIEIIEERIHKARLALMDFKFDEAKRVYIEIMKKYNGLEPKDKSKVYQDIKDLYYERKSAEKFSK